MQKPCSLAYNNHMVSNSYAVHTDSWVLVFLSGCRKTPRVMYPRSIHSLQTLTSSKLITTQTADQKNHSHRRIIHHWVVVRGSIVCFPGHWEIFRNKWWMAELGRKVI